MKLFFTVFLVFLIISPFAACDAGASGSDDSHIDDPGADDPDPADEDDPGINPPGPVVPPQKQYRVYIDFVWGGGNEGYDNIYAIWIDNEAEHFFHNIYICDRVLGIKKKLANQALPFWKVNIFDANSLETPDVITAATKAKKDFSESALLSNPSIRQFRVCFEIDRSFEFNDWFNGGGYSPIDQPALLYTVDVDLDNPLSEYTMILRGWTPNDGQINAIPDTPYGVLQSELRYITHTKDGVTFGVSDDKAETKMVSSLKVRLVEVE